MRYTITVEVKEAQKNKSERQIYLEKFLNGCVYSKDKDTPEVISYNLTIGGEKWTLEYYPFSDSIQINYPNSGCVFIKFSEGIGSTFEDCLRAHLINNSK